MFFLARALCVLAPLTVVVFVIVQAVTLPQPPPKPLVAVPAFRLFPPNAAISLTEDNSTFFPARPAAFGPELPEIGLSAVLWIGAGFGEDGVEPQGELGCSDVPGWDSRRAADGAPILPTKTDLDDGSDNYLEDFATGHYYGQPPKSRRKKASGDKKSRTVAAVAAAAAVDTTPEAAATGIAVAQAAKSTTVPKAKAANKNNGNEGGSRHGDIQSLQEGAEIAGKIVLLRRGGCGFLAKVMWAQRRGAVAVIVGDDRKGGPLIQMFASGDTSDVLIPSVFTAHTTAHLLTALAVDAVRESDLAAAAAAATRAVAAAAAGEGAGTKTGTPTPQQTEGGERREWVLAEYVPTDEAEKDSDEGTTALAARMRVAKQAELIGAADSRSSSGRQLLVTIAPARGGLPLIDTLLVLVASPLLAIMTITCVLLFLRTHCRHRAWRAPKALVDQLPVHIYRPPGAAPPSPMMLPVGSEVASPNPSRPSSPTLNSMHPTVTTPLLQRPRSRTTTGVPGDERRVLVAVAVPLPPPSRYVQSECVVCLEDYVAGDRIMSLPCGHEFHASCIIPWLTTRRRTCPICKGDIVRASSGDAA
ncbi:PA domain containing protein [Grosmannia clavigera kw1407]|uniref:RING-type E3 ubiquitin transferase n=1 Tax=Grosmannia clavigera (strain kw1407 / UAMH 11150) TaxID=655863 RepID=F0XBB3_GROCL|nr:PA domain containing protein [Grosmannia clavigera kw1407]EFX04951.1 PA domain containing protein [Grosmannia clavigera kw1407]